MQELVEGCDQRQLGLGEAAVLAVQALQQEAVVAGMETDRHIEILCHFIQREEPLGIKRRIVFDTMKIHAAGAVFLAERQLVAESLHAQQMRHHYPAQPVRRLFPDIRQPAVIAAAQRVFEFRPLGPGAQKDSRVQHLNGDFQRVHMGKPGADILHLARLARRVRADIAFLRQHPVIHVPELALRHPAGTRHRAAGLQRLNHQRSVMFEFRLEKIEGAFALDDMRVGIDRSHGGLPSRILFLWREVYTERSGRSGGENTPIPSLVMVGEGRP